MLHLFKTDRSTPCLNPSEALLHQIQSLAPHHDPMALPLLLPRGPSLPWLQPRGPALGTVRIPGPAKQLLWPQMPLASPHSVTLHVYSLQPILGWGGRKCPQHTPHTFLLPKPSLFSSHQGTQTT